MAVRILDAYFDPAVELASHASSLTVGQFGAAAHFVGTMRNTNQGDSITSMTLEHYADMTNKELNTIIDETHRQWKLIDALIVHRVGKITPGEPIVLTAVWSEHRAAAFDACRFLMEALKGRAPFWKKETLADGTERWVERNTPGV